MRFYSTKFVPCVAVFGLAMLAGCGDTYEVTEATGMKVIAIDEKVPDCTKDNVGEMIFVAKVSEVYYCANNEWSTLNGKDGEDGVDGKDGVNGENGKNGENGENGLNGAQGEQGVRGEKGVQGAQGVQGVQGEKGDTGAGCTSEDKLDGRVILTCGTGDDAVTTTLYKAMCGTQYYDPEKSKCVENRVVVTSGTMTDPRDNDREYKTVTLKAESYKATWMAQSLNYVVDDGNQSWCYKGGKIKLSEEESKQHCETYGRHYSWEGAMNACPTGWHLPSNAEMENLLIVVGGESTAGIKLKSNSELWTSGGTTNTDDFGFSALPSGVSFSNDYSVDVGKFVDFWLSTQNEDDSSLAYAMSLGYDREYAKIHVNNAKFFGYSVRCVKD